MYARVHERFLRKTERIFLRAIIYNHVAEKNRDIRESDVAECLANTRSLTNAHVLSRGNYHIKVSLVIPNTVLIATLDNLLNCSIMRHCSSPSSASLEGFKDPYPLPSARFRRLRGKLCGYFVHIVYGNRSRTLQYASFRIF